MIDDNTVIARGRELMEAELADEIVALCPATSQCYAFNPTAAALWRAIAVPQRFGALVDTLCTQFAVDRETCAADVAAAIDDLRRDGVVRAQAAVR